MTMHGQNSHGVEVHYRPANPLEQSEPPVPDISPGTRLIPAGSVHADGARPVPVDIQVLEDVAVPLRDGMTLYGDVYLPAHAGPVPAVLIYTPYSKRGGTGTRPCRPPASEFRRAPSPVFSRSRRSTLRTGASTTTRSSWSTHAEPPTPKATWPSRAPRPAATCTTRLSGSPPRDGRRAGSRWPATPSSPWFSGPPPLCARRI